MITVGDIQHTEDIDEALEDGLWLYIDQDETVMELHRDGNVIASCFISDYLMEEHMADLWHTDKCAVYDHFCQYCIDNWL